MSKTDLSAVLGSITTVNTARVVAALVVLDKWGERVTYVDIARALEGLELPSDDSTIARGLRSAIAEQLILEIRKGDRAWGYRPGHALAQALGRAR